MRNTLAILLFASTVSAAELPRYWSVHIDVPSDRAAFEKIDSEFSQTQRDFYAEHHVDYPPVINFKTADGAYYGLRPRGSLSDFEKPNPLGDAAKDLRTKLAPISAATHELLRTHHNEIWQLDSDLTSISSDRVPKYVLLRTDVVTPPNDEAYGTAMKQLIEEVKASGAGVLAFFSVYGDGAYRYVFVSDRPLKIRNVGKLARTRDEPVSTQHWFSN
jgi:hypothetical protein